MIYFGRLDIKMFIYWLHAFFLTLHGVMLLFSLETQGCTIFDNLGNLATFCSDSCFVSEFGRNYTMKVKSYH